MLCKDFKEFLNLLNLNQVEYLVVGGYALAALFTMQFPARHPPPRFAQSHTAHRA